MKILYYNEKQKSVSHNCFIYNLKNAALGDINKA